MMRILRKHRNWMMAVIAVLALPFIFYWNKTDPSRERDDKFRRVYGRDVSMIEARRNANFCNLARALGMQTLIRSLGVGANSEDELYNEFALNLIVLRHEAEKLGIKPTTAEITDFVRTLRPFRNASGFDPKKYDEFTQTVLPSMGMGEAQIEEIAADELALNRIKELVTAGVTVPESQSKFEYEQIYGKLDVSIVRLRGSDFAKDVKMTDDDIAKYYEAHKATLKTDEKRKVEFVTLALTDEQKKLAGKERTDALQKLADRANELTQALGEKGAEFHQVAAHFQLPVSATGDFTANAGDPKLKADPELGTIAFQLTSQDPNSDAVQGRDGFYVLHLVNVTPERQLSVEEAKPKIVEALTARRSREMVETKGAQVSHDLHELLLSGAPLSFACEKANVKAEKLEPFSLSEDMDPEEAPKEPKKRPPDFLAVRNAVANLQPGEVSQFMPAEDGGVVAILEKRELPDEKKFAEKRADFDRKILANKREIVFYEWLHDCQKEAGILTAKDSPG
jgi:PPIC-type PPIASE domain/SurA N-terminal domain